MSASIFIGHSAKDVEGRRSPGDVWLDEARLKGGDDRGVVIANLFIVRSRHASILDF